MTGGDTVEILWKGYTDKAATFSYDDGVYSGGTKGTADYDLIQIFNKYGVKATFNIVGKYVNAATAAAEDGSMLQTYIGAYDGHEVASHSLNHEKMNTWDATDENKAKALEEVAGNNPVLGAAFSGYNSDKYGFAWPYAYPWKLDTDGSLTAAIKESGAAYIRPVTNTLSFDLPTNFYDWSPTSNDTGKYNQTGLGPATSGDNITTLTPKLLADNKGGLRLMYLWGHAADLWGTGGAGSNGVTYGVFEQNLRTLVESGVYIDTNMAIHDYIQAVRRLKKNDPKTVTNNSDMTIYARINGVNTEIAPGETIRGGEIKY